MDARQYARRLTLHSQRSRVAAIFLLEVDPSLSEGACTIRESVDASFGVVVPGSEIPLGCPARRNFGIQVSGCPN